MKHRMLSLCLIILLLFSYFSTQVFASDLNSKSSSYIITYEDGSYLESTVIESGARAIGTRSGTRLLNYRSSDDELLWQAALSASFTYTGTTSTCTSASCTLTIYDSNWYQVSKSTSRSGNTATTVLTMGQKVLGVTIAKPSYTITLSCDANGNLS